MKKVLALGLLALMIFSICSCAGTADDGNTVLDFTQNEVNEDWDGLKFTIVQTSLTDETYLYYKLDTLLADSARQRVKDVEEKHNITISLKGYAEGDAFKALLNATMITGEPMGDILFADPSQLRSFANAGGLTPIEAVSDYINIYDSDKWGESNAWEFMMCKGVMYGVVPFAWVGNAPYVFYPIIYNADIVRSFGLGDLREYYETGEWSREKMLDIAVQCTDNTLASPIKGMAACLKHFIRSALLSNGTQFAVFSDDLQSYSCGWVSDAGIEALDWVKSVIDNYDDYFLNLTSTADDWGYTNNFNDNEAAMLLTASNRVLDEISYKVENFGLMPFPVGPYGTYGQWVGFYEGARNLCIPAYAAYPEASAIVINEIFEPLAEYPDKAAIDDYYVKLVYSDPRDVQLLNVMSSNCKYSFWPDGGDAVLNKLYTDLPKSSPIELLESYGSLSDQCIVEQMIPSILEVQRLLGE